MTESLRVGLQDGRLASPLVVTDIILPCFNWSQVQEGAKDQAEGFDWLNNESLVVQQLALLYFVIKVGGPTQVGSASSAYRSGLDTLTECGLGPAESAPDC